MMKRQHITVIPRDGIGPSLMTAALKVLDKLGCEFEYDYAEIGQAALDAGKDILPEEVLDLIRKNKIAIKGPITTPIGEGFNSVNVSLRRHFNLYANFRPVVSYPISLFLASALILHLNLGHRAKSLRGAVRDALQKRDGVTADLSGEGSTAEFTDALLERL